MGARFNARGSGRTLIEMDAGVRKPEREDGAAGAVNHRRDRRARSLLGKGALAGLVSVVLGTGSAALGIWQVTERTAVENGPWMTNLAAGSKNAGMYERAAIAVIALFANSRAETIYFTAFTDSQGETLRSECDYELRGHDLDARWWSITAYGPDGFLIPNDEDRYSYNLQNLAREPDGSYAVQLASERRRGNWLPLNLSGGFSLTIRLYNPGGSVTRSPGEVHLPRISKRGCR
jgi:hypothetical protein